MGWKPYQNETDVGGLESQWRKNNLLSLSICRLLLFLIWRVLLGKESAASLETNNADLHVCIQIPSAHWQ